jgi:hypothetical protein
MTDIWHYLPIIIRYVLVAVAGAFTARGWITPESHSVISQNIDILVGAFVALATVGYELAKRPSSKALEVAKEVDKNIPSAEMVVIKTPGNAPDIFVDAKK